MVSDPCNLPSLSAYQIIDPCDAGMSARMFARMIARMSARTTASKYGHSCSWSQLPSLRSAIHSEGFIGLLQSRHAAVWCDPLHRMVAPFIQCNHHLVLSLGYVTCAAAHASGLLDGWGNAIL